MTDGRCRFGPRAKREMVARLLAGEKARQVARSMGCSPTTVTTARDRWLAASEAERASGAWCVPRRPVPLSCPWALSREAEQVILDARARTNWGPMRLTWLTGRHRSTCWKVLKRHGVSRQRRSQPRQFGESRPTPAELFRKLGHARQRIVSLSLCLVAASTSFPGSGVGRGAVGRVEGEEPVGRRA